MNAKRYAAAFLLALIAVAPGVMSAQTGTGTGISQKRHPNLAAALRMTTRADGKIHSAQEANEFDLGGHALQAMKDLDDAEAQLKMAAGTSNQQHGAGNP